MKGDATSAVRCSRSFFRILVTGCQWMHVVASMQSTCKSLHRGRGCDGGAIGFSIHPSVYQASLYLPIPVDITHTPLSSHPQAGVSIPHILTPPAPFVSSARASSPPLPPNGLHSCPSVQPISPSRGYQPTDPPPTLPPPWVGVEARGRVGGLRLLGRRCWGGEVWEGGENLGVFVGGAGEGGVRGMAT